MNIEMGCLLKDEAIKEDCACSPSMRVLLIIVFSSKAKILVCSFLFDQTARHFLCA